jgi:hypothetical protein
LTNEARANEANKARRERLRQRRLDVAKTREKIDEATVQDQTARRGKDKPTKKRSRQDVAKTR